MKTLCNFSSNSDNLWCKLIRSKYKCGWRGFPKIEFDPKRKGSNFWNGLGVTWEAFRKNLCWQLGNGESIGFWSDKWLTGCDALSSYCSNTLNDDTINLPISHFFSYEGDWNVTSIEEMLSEDILQRVFNTNPPSILQ